MAMSWEDEADQLMSNAQKAQKDQSDAESWNPEEGDKLTGIMLSGAMLPTKYGPAKIMTVKDSDDKTWTVWCTATVLKNQLEEQAPTPGKGVSILFNGMKEPKNAGGNRYKSFTLISEETDHQYWLDVLSGFQAREQEAQQSSGGSSAPFNSNDDEDFAPY
jgi:hypothetical protein